MTSLRRLPRLFATALVLYAWVASIAAQSTSDASTAASDRTLLITSAIGFLGVLATQWFAIWRFSLEKKAEERRRKWDLEDREQARKEMRRNYEAQRIETIAVAAEIAHVHRTNTERIVQEVSKNTEVTEAVGVKADAAYSAANDFNARMEEMRRQLFAKGTQIDAIEELSTDTNVKVTDLAEGKP